MAVISRRTGGAVSKQARARIGALQAYPTLDTWRNPLTRGIARHFAHDGWLKALDEIDFEYRLTELEVADTACMLYETGALNADAPFLLYVHGGGFVSGSPHTHASVALPICHLAGCNGLGAGYSLLPEAHFPTQIEEISNIYRSVIEDRSEQKVVVVADSTGCAIALAAIMQWRDQELKMPEGIVLLSPCVDGEGSSDTHLTLDDHDPLFQSAGGKFFRRLFRYYSASRDLSAPAVSPLYGDFTNLPPMMVHAGAREVLLGDALRLAEQARQSGVNTTLRVFDGMFHVFHRHWTLEEAKAAHEDLAEFVSRI